MFLPMSEAQRFWTYRLLTRLDTEELREIFEQGKEEAGDRNAREAKAYIKDKLSEGKTGSNRTSHVSSRQPGASADMHLQSGSG